jgi:signal transduction histidine kinase
LSNDQDEGAVLRNTRAATKILSSGGRMKAMIEQLLDFTRARSGGGIAIEPRPTSLADLCVQGLEELELSNPTWRLARRFAGDPNGFWDPDRMLQVVCNLVSNAGQHGRAGGTITVSVDGTAAAQVIFEVHNEGAIASASTNELFDPFRSFGQPRSRSGGLGLGLFIVSEIVKAHGGSVDVVSSEDHGTSFVVLLPRSAQPAVAASVPVAGA